MNCSVARIIKSVMHTPLFGADTEVGAWRVLFLI
jgi:hypothetical protein